MAKSSAGNDGEEDSHASLTVRAELDWYRVRLGITSRVAMTSLPPVGVNLQALLLWTKKKERPRASVSLSVLQ